MRLLKGWKLTLMASMALAGTGGHVFAQKPGSLDPNMLGPGSMGSLPVSYVMQDNGVPRVDHPESRVGTDPGMGYPPPYPMDPSMMGGPGGPMMGGPEGPCPECGGPCPGCGGAHSDGWGRNLFGLLGHMRGKVCTIPGMLMPYGEGGIATQRWFDASIEVIGMARTTGASTFNVSSLGPGSGNFVLSTDNVDLDDMRAGLAAQINIQTGPGSSLELLYFGLDEWDSTASAQSSTADLYSFISNFGTLPAGGFDDSDRSLQHTINYTSELHNGELSFRRRWAEPYGFFQGSFLTGVRYLDLDEGSRFTAEGLNNNGAANNGPRFFDYSVATTNSLVGWQVGGDLWYNFIPGVKFGVELKTGIYNNRARQSTSIFANSLPAFGIPAIQESVLTNDTAFVTQLSPQMVYRLNYSCAFRTSLQVLWIDNVALAANNYNSVPPALIGPDLGRVPSINTKSDIVYTGLTAGIEYMW